MMGGKTGAHFTADNSAPTFTRGRASANDVHAVALEGNKKSWWNGEDVAQTTTTTGHNQLMPDKDRFDAVVECYENNTLNHSEVCRTLTGNHDDRVTDTGTSVVVSTNSNGEDVAPTISSCEYKMGQKQKDTGGGYILTRREEGAHDEPQL